MCASALWRSCSVIVPLATWRAMLPLMVARPALMRSSLTSCRRTSRPAQAHTWAMPLPICPAPMTPMVLMSTPMGAAPYPFIEISRESLAARLRQFLLQLRQDLEEIAHKAVIGDLEDRRLFVLV